MGQMRDPTRRIFAVVVVVVAGIGIDVLMLNIHIGIGIHKSYTIYVAFGWEMGMGCVFLFIGVRGMENESEPIGFGIEDGIAKIRFVKYWAFPLTKVLHKEG